ncbi:hypothetical protein OBBRIDRAFT_734497, partial [Obba rivulosa]
MHESATPRKRKVTRTLQEEPAPDRAEHASAPVPPASRPRGARQPVAPPETGRPETAREFSKRIWRVVLRGPCAERQEGERVMSTLPETHDERQVERGASELRDVPGPSRREHADSVDQRPMSMLETTIADVVPPHAALDDRIIDLLASEAPPEGVSAALRGRYSEDPFFREILEKPKQFKNFTTHDGLVYLKDKQRDLLCIPRALWEGRSLREVVILHAHTLLAHLGAYKTLSLLRDHVWWKT